MKTKNLKAILVMVVIFACVSTVCFATNTAVPTSENIVADNTAVDNTTGENETTATPTEELEKHTGDYFEGGASVEVNKAIDGNAFVMGGNVTIKGVINGDLYVLASNSITIAQGGAVYGNVFALAPNVTLDGLVYSLFTLTDNFVCKYNGMAALDLKVYAKNIDFAGYIERHVYFAASESMTFQEDACILGNLNYAAKNVNIHENSTVKGETFASDFSNFVATPGQVISSYVTSIITTLTFLLVVLLAILLVKPSIIQNTSKHLTENPWKTLGFGALALVIIPVLAVLCMFLQALSSVAVVLCVIYFVLLVLSSIIVTIGLAKYIDSKVQKTHSETSILAYVIIVGVVLWALTQIPYVGIIVSLAIWIFGLGTIVVSLLPHKSAKSEVPAKVESKEEKEVEAKEVKKEKTEKKDKKDKEEK